MLNTKKENTMTTMTKVCSEAELRELAILHNITPTRAPYVGPYGEPTVYMFMKEQCPNIPNNWQFVQIEMGKDGGFMHNNDHTDADFDRAKNWIQNELHTGNE